MTFKTNKLRNAITLAIAGTTVLAGSGVALAQDTPSDEKELDTITVTGSRIVRRAETETQQPIFELSREDIQAQGLTSVGDVIQNITANGSALNTTNNNGGNGETRVSLRNLGTNRTLVLVNGRRWVAGTGLGGAVDLNTIPTAAVERIEVLKDGASVIYGSDAIAGVVNVILRTDYQGAEFNAYMGEFTEGDGTRQSYDLTIGTSDDRFSAMFGMGYVKEDPVLAGDRTISSFPIINTGTALGSSTSPGGRFAVCNGTFSGGVCSGTQTRPDGSAGQFTYNPGSTGNAWRNFLIPADIYNFAPDNYLVTPQERKSLFGRASLNLTDNTRVFITGTYNNRRSEQLLAAMPIVLGTGPGAGSIARTISISADNIYNPFGLDVSRIQRRAVETGGRSFNQNVDTFGFNGGIEGSFELGDRYFTWDAGMVYGRNDQNDTTNGLFNLLALRQALGPSMLVNGTPTCVATPGNAATAISGCVPLNLLGGPGSITPEMLAFSSFVAHDEFGYKMKQYYANVSGEIVELPGGMLSFAFGLERRTEQGFDQPDALIASGNTTGNSRTPTKGGYKLEEAFLEFAIPLLRDVPGAQELELSVAGRYSDYSNFGDTTNGKFGFKWRPIKDLMIRGNWSEGFRAPSVAELFSGVADSFPTLADPCSTTFGGQWGNLNADEQARCVAQGVPAGVGYDQGNGQIRISTGGNTNLSPETSTTRTIGLVWSPSFLEGFNVSLDWWKIKLEDAIITRSGQYILNSCIRDQPNGNEERQAADDALCALANVQRDSSGQITNLLAVPQNLGKRTAEGYDMTINYNLPENVLGNFSFTLDTTYMASATSQDDENGFVGEYGDRNNNWRLRSNFMARWTKGDWGATWFTRYYSRQDEQCPFYYNDYGFGELCTDAILDSNGVVQPGSENRMGGTTYHDVSVFWKAPWNGKITVGVNNVFAKEPPISYSTFANSFDPNYEIPGRFVYMQYNQKF